ncbi:MAG: sulfatase-like hydrolase/transferase [Burkholderiaceae bacterium]|nr:sulfatase-like hydrolase/transferase [Burkholderiaceae bacterium]
MLVVAGPPMWWLWRRPLARRGWLPQTGRNALGAVAGLAVVTLAALLAFQDLASLMRNDRSLRYMINPLNTVYAATRLAADELRDQGRELLPTGEDARPGPSYAGQRRPPLLLVVVGETARARNFGLNGYPRETTPALARWQAAQGLVNFGPVESCGTSTQVSLPCMFSPLAREQGGDRSADRENLLDVLHRAGLAVLWIDNRAGCKGVCARVPTVSTTRLRVPGLCADGECFDEVMLRDLDARIAALDAQRRARGVVVVMHQMGSHGPAYFRRTPPGRKPFQPECASNTLSDCTAESLRNAYDNTIAYTDHFLDLALQWLKTRADAGAWDTGLVYVSDHGESLGENGLYLHGVARALAPREQTQVPMVLWLSPGLQRRDGLRGECPGERAAQPVSHDHLFHTVLGVMDIATGVHDRSLDALAPCAAR